MPTYTDYVDQVQQQFANPAEELTTEGNKYNIRAHTYPSDLGSQDLKHFVLFNINVRGKSTYDTGAKRLFEVKRAESSGGLTTDQLGTAAVAGTAAAAAVAAGAAVSSLVSNATRSVGKTGAKSIAPTRAQAAGKTAAKVAIVGGTALVAGGVAAVAVSNLDMLKKDTSHRISDAIALYVDGPPTVKYSMNYANKDLGTLMGLLSGSVLDSKGGAGEAASAMGASMAKLPGAFGGGDLSSAISKSSGTALNPFREIVFESVDFRTFNFKYKFFPKSKAESDSVHNILELFKEHMHPELSAGKLFFIYPSEFQITYYFESKVNPYFHKFRPCALENLDISYGGEQFSTFKDGTPTEINLTLTFRELEILTRKSIREGY
jgi:hypothetical protein